MKKSCFILALLVFLTLPAIGQSKEMSLFEFKGAHDCISHEMKDFTKIFNGFEAYFGIVDKEYWYHLEYPTGVSETLYYTPNDGWEHIVSTTKAGELYRKRHQPKAIGGVKTHPNGAVYWMVKAP